MQKLYRSSRDKKITGLCGGLSEYLNVDATLIRILLIVVSAFSAGSIIAVYVIASLVVPKEPTSYGGFGPNFNSSFNHNDNFDVPPYGARPTRNYNQQHYGSQQPNNFQVPPKPNWNEPEYKPNQETDQQFDSMMNDLEKKALKREIEQLKSKIEKYEKGE